MNSVDYWTSGFLWEAVLFPSRNMCLGGICSCAFTWQNNSEYRNEGVLAGQPAYSSILCAFKI